jgi:hypothetical protein
MKRIIPLLFLVLFITVVGCKYEGLQVREATPEDIALAQASDEQKQFLAEEAARVRQRDMELAEESEAIGVGLIKVTDGTDSGWVKQITFTADTVDISGADATVTISGVSPGSGSVTTVQEQDAAGGGSDADIVVIDFQEGFSVAEAPDTEVNISLDVTPAVGKPTLVIEDDAINVLYDTTDFGEETTNGLVLGASPTIATSLAIGTDPADAGALRLANAGYIYSEKAVTGTDISVIGVDASDVVQIAASGSSGAVITPATTITGKITTGSSIELGHASDTTIKRDSAGVISVEDAVVTLLGATIGASEVDADVATQAELDAVAALVDTDDEIIAIINASPSTQELIPAQP